MKKDKEWLLREFRKLTFELQNGYAKVKAVDILPLIDQLDEPEKVIVPKFVADTIVCFTKGELGDRPGENSVFNFIDNLEGDFRNGYHKETKAWFYKSLQNQIDLEMAWLNGYEVEKEKLYIVQLPTNLEDDLIILDADGDIWKDSWPSRYKMTEKRIKEIDERFWPFAVEVEE